MSDRARFFASDHQFKNLNKFPNTPKQGMPAFVNNVFYIYGQLGSIEAWVPLLSSTISYIHSQGVVSNTWTIQHGMDTADVLVGVYDLQGQAIYPTITHSNASGEWVTTLNFDVQVDGYAIVFGNNTVDARLVNADGVNVRTTLTVKGKVVPVTPAEIKASYESNADTNVLTDALLALILAGNNNGGGPRGLFSGGLF